ncbi:MAG: hypothetical protein IPM39_25620 [Chloroflexi bacterium]|nr:hypothetical protein [Chloroflexota bacterium]
MDKRTTNILLVGIALLAMVLLMSGMWLVFQGMSASAEPSASQPAPTAVANLPAATTAVQETLPTAPAPTALAPTTQSTLVALPPSATPPPTVTPTETPVVTDTPVPTDTPPPTATNVPPPVVIVPTNTPVPPANTPVPTPSGPQPGTVNGVSASHFALQNRAQLWVNGDIWFEFTVNNSGNNSVPYGALGVMPRRNGADMLPWFQRSWGGNDDALNPGNLSWDDRIRIPEAGSYTLRLVICFEAGATCMSGGGTFHTLSQEIAVTLP